MGVETLVVGLALFPRCLQDLRCQAFGHRVLAALPRRSDDPAERKRNLAIRRDLIWNLVVRTTDPAGSNLEPWRAVGDRFVERLE